MEDHQCAASPSGLYWSLFCRSAGSNTSTLRTSSTETWSLTTSWWGLERRATWSTSSTLAWPRSTAMPEHTSTSLTARTRTSPVPPATPPSTPIWASVRKHMQNARVSVHHLVKCSLQLFSSSFLSAFINFAPLSIWFVLFVLSPQSSPDEMIWSLWATSSCTSTWALCPGRGSKLPPKGRSMNASARRKCPLPLRSFAKDTLVSKN